MIQDPKVRAYIYRVVLAAIPLLQFFRLVDGDAVPLIINIVTAVLGVGAAGLALPNTPTASATPANSDGLDITAPGTIDVLSSGAINIHASGDPVATARAIAKHRA